MKKLMSIILALVMLLSLTACGDKGSNDGSTTQSTQSTQSTQGSSSSAPLQLDMAEVYTTITEGVEMPEMMQVESDMLFDLYGVKGEYCVQSVVYICVNSLRADEIWLMEASDAESLTKLKDLAQARLDQKDAESVTYSPEQNVVVKAAQVIEVGNYLVMIVSPDVDAIADAFRAQAGI